MQISDNFDITFLHACLVTYSKNLTKFCIDNRTSASAINLYYKCYLKILSKLHEPSGECNLKEFKISRVV